MTQTYTSQTRAHSQGLHLLNPLIPKLCAPENIHGVTRHAMADFIYIYILLKIRTAS